MLLGLILFGLGIAAIVLLFKILGGIFEIIIGLLSLFTGN